MKKCNAVLGLAAGFLVLAHMVLMGGLLTGLLSYQRWYVFFARAAVVLFILHIAVSLVIFFFCSDRGNEGGYSRYNVGTILQRICALVMLGGIHLHFAGGFFSKEGVSVIQSPQMLPLLLGQILFLASVCLHLAISAPRACITLGLFTSRRALRSVSVVCAVLAVFAGVFAGVGIVLYAL